METTLGGLAKAWVIVLSLILSCVSIVSVADEKQDQTILIGFYIGDLTENPALDRVRLYSRDAFPQLSQLKTRMASGEDPSLSAIDAILDVAGLTKVDILGFYRKPWPDKKATADYFVTPGGIGWLFSGSPKPISPEKLLMRAKVSMFSDIPNLDAEDREEKYKEIIRYYQSKNPDMTREEDIPLNLFEPVLISFPFRDKVLFTFLALANSPAPSGLMKRDASNPESLEGAPQPLLQIAPHYPLELRSIRGHVDLRITIDQKGAVTSARVEKSLHPYLDYAAVKALLQWKFVPIQVHGKPAPATFMFACIFDPLRQETQEVSADAGAVPSPETDAILVRCADYVRKMVAAAPFFLCQEDIREKHRFMTPTDRPTLVRLENEYDVQNPSGQRQNVKSFSTYRINFSERLERNRFIDEYQILGQGGQIRERRLLLERNGRKLKEAPIPWEEKRFLILNPYLLAIRLLDADSRSSFSYRLLGQEKISRRAAYVVQALPTSSRSGFVEEAKIWIEKDGYKILKIETRGIPFDGYDDVWQEAAAFNLIPTSTITHLFEVENKGIRYPSRTTVVIQYPMPDPIRVIDKIIIETVFKKFRFFSVETEHHIK
jgi:TonB family protein